MFMSKSINYLCIELLVLDVCGGVWKDVDGNEGEKEKDHIVISCARKDGGECRDHLVCP
jgi:hypothetical protein